MKVGDLIEYVDAKEYQTWFGRRGEVTGVGVGIVYVRFFGQTDLNGFFSQRLKVISVDDLTGEECAMLMKKEMLGGGG